MKPHVQVASEMAEVDAILRSAIASGNPLLATDHGNQLSKSMTIKGVALAKLFHGMRDNWSLFRAAGIQEEFPDFVDAHMLIKGKTAVKYADMYEAVFENNSISEPVREQLQQKPMTTLLLLTAAVREGSLTEDDLETVAVLDHSGVHQMVREARGDVTSSRTSVYARLVQREHGMYPKGSLVVFGGGESEPIGYLKLEPETEAGQKFLERLINRLGLEDIR